MERHSLQGTFWKTRWAQSGLPEANQTWRPCLQEYGVVSYIGQGIARVQWPAQCGIGRTHPVRRRPAGHGIQSGSRTILESSCSTIRRALSPARRPDARSACSTHLWAKRLIGRVIDPLGRPLDNAGPVNTTLRAPIECSAPAIMDRAPVTVPLATGVKVVDALIPVGRGQRELILGDRQTGKTAIALDCILNQKGKDVICIYCAIGQRNSSVAKLIADLKRPAPWITRS